MLVKRSGQAISVTAVVAMVTSLLVAVATQKLNRERFIGFRHPANLATF